MLNLTADVNEYNKWRVAYSGGRMFVNQYLYKFSKHEDDEAFHRRRLLTYCTRFAGCAIDEVSHSIFQRMVDIIRKSESTTFMESVHGRLGGVDMRGSSLNYFLGKKVLPELLVMQKVGVYVDNSSYEQNNYADSITKARPYLYMYPRENISVCRRDCFNRIVELQLNDAVEEDGIEFTRTRHYTLENGFVSYKISKKDGGYDEGILQMPEIPFVELSISNSLMKDIADYQIALMNIESSDINFIMKSGFPFYVEFYDVASDGIIAGMESSTQDGPGEDNDITSAANKEILVGGTTGRRIPRGLESPRFIAPPTENLTASMEKAQQIKQDIRNLLSLSLAQLKPTRSSAESKQEDTGKEENGLSYIGEELQNAERLILKYWQWYEGIATEGEIYYPETYEIRPLTDRVSEADSLLEMAIRIPSDTFKREAAKKVASLVIGPRTSPDIMAKIFAELNDTACPLLDADSLLADVEAGISSHRLAAKLRGYPAGTVAQAEKEYLDRVRSAAIAQSEVASEAEEDGGSADPSKDPSDLKEEKKESQDPNNNPEGKKRVRGTA